MNSIEDLRRMLSTVNVAAAKSFVLPIAEFEKAHLEVQVGMMQKASLLKDRKLIDLDEQIRTAVFSWRDNRELGFRDLCRACAGCTRKLAPSGYMLLDDHAALARLFLHLDQERGSAQRHFVKLYGRLVKAYFNHEDKTQSGLANREILRIFLKEKQEDALAGASRHGWAKAIREHPDLLGRSPGKPFSSQILSGDWTEFSEASLSLGLAGDSWLSHAVIRETTHAAVSENDHSFKSHIETLLDLIREDRFASLRDDALAQIIERYRNCENPNIHSALRDFSVSAWKNPWLPLNKTAWGRVSKEARQMIVGWLKLDLVSAFFNRLSEDGLGDRSRFEFWRRYLGQINDMYFILGQNTFKSPNPDIRKLIQKLEGRHLQLGSTDPAINAFVMLTKYAAIVEFSKLGNATYVYRGGDLPTSLHDKARVEIAALRDTRRGERLIHRRVGGQSWQSLFENALRNRFGLCPDKEGDGSNTARTQSDISASPDRYRPIQFDDAAFRKLMTRENLRWRDNRAQGGNLLVDIDSLSSHVAAQLERWGFSRRPKGGWYLSSD